MSTITGKTHPELFLPHEVFDELVQFAFLSKPRVSDAFRKAMMPTVSQYGLPGDFWERLRNISAVYIADANRAYDFPVGKRPRTEMSAREQREFDREHDRNYALLCRSRIEALAEARRQFGGEVIDRFLYGAIAPNMFRTAFDSESAENLRRLEEGCR
ncbi:MAG TPA: hypothetical protein VHW00_19815 [Thermoanaerobaculia bacterium]|nr:hypothetical protein [Thermoanaerobaculia bacterium]